MIDNGSPEDEEMAGTGAKPTPETAPADEPGVRFHEPPSSASHHIKEGRYAST